MINEFCNAALQHRQPRPSRFWERSSLVTLQMSQQIPFLAGALAARGRLFRKLRLFRDLWKLVGRIHSSFRVPTHMMQDSCEPREPAPVGFQRNWFHLIELLIGADGRCGSSFARLLWPLCPDRPLSIYTNIYQKYCELCCTLSGTVMTRCCKVGV